MKSEMPRVFFAHSTHSFGSDTETSILKLLREKYRVLCPNQDIGRLEQFKKYQNFIGWADMVIVLKHEKYLTMGVFSEVLHALKLGIPILVVRETPAGFVFARVDRIEYQPNRENRNQYGKIITQ